MEQSDNIQLFQFQNEEYLYFLFLIPLMVLVYLWLQYSKNKALERFGDRELVKRLMPEASKTRNWIKFIVLNLVLTAIILAVARPQFGSKIKETEREAAEIIIALDVSNSMLAEDIRPNRLERAKKAIVRLLQKSKNDKIGLIVFGGKAYTQIPLTNDYSGAELYLEALSTDAVPVQGTNINAAIRHGIASFSPETETGKVLIIITDGENHEEEALTAAENAADNNITVNTIGMGLPKPTTIPDPKRGGLKKKRNGEPVLTKLNESLLKQIAKAGNGIYTSGNNIEAGLSEISKQLAKTGKSKIKMKVEEFDDYYISLIYIALILLILEFIILERKNRWLSKLKLFD